MRDVAQAFLGNSLPAINKPTKGSQLRSRPDAQEHVQTCETLRHSDETEGLGRRYDDTTNLHNTSIP